MFGLFSKSDADSMTFYEAQAAGALIVDIRNPAEWAQSGVLPGARLITFAGLPSFLSALRPYINPNTPVALICASGARSAQAQKLLAGKIDAPVVNIKGGMMGAMRAGQPVTPPTRKAGCTTC
ncbi:MAG: rhodanese-like domain-containing protein [Roseinatronobacter sp.]